MKPSALLAATLLLLPMAPGASERGPDRGALVIAGGGRLGTEIVERFIQLAGGTEAHFVVVPTAEASEDPADFDRQARFLRTAGVSRITILHTRDRQQADQEEFVRPLQRANAVWFGGGRQWRFVDAYLGTRAEREFHALLARGGVIGGSSAGATIQGSYLVRGAREGNHIMMAKGYEQGFGFIRNSAIDQHLIVRKREMDLVEVVRTHPHLLGIGIDEGTAVVVQGDVAEVIGSSKVAVYHFGEEPPFRLLQAGERFDLRSPRGVDASRQSPPSKGSSLPVGAER